MSIASIAHRTTGPFSSLVRMQCVQQVCLKLNCTYSCPFNIYLCIIISRIQNGLNDTSDLQNPSSKLALIVLYQSMLKHDDGIEWLKREQAWKRALNYCIQDQTIYVVRRASAFLIDFLFRTNDDDALCLEIITEISRPIDENVFVEQIGDVNVDSNDLEQTITPSLNLICAILDRYIQVNRKSNIGQHIMWTTKGMTNLWKLTDMTHDRVLFGRISKGLIYTTFATLVDKLNENSTKDGSAVSVIDFNDFGLSFLNLCKFIVLKKQIEVLLSVTKLYYTLWKGMGDRAPEEIILGNQLTKFENQVILFQILPLFSAMFDKDECIPELLDEYRAKLFNISTEHTVRICYAFRDTVTSANVDIYDLSCKSIQGILSMIHILHRDRAIIVFQALCHILRGVKSKEGSNEIPRLIARPSFMSAVLSGLYSICKKYRITWKDSYESIGLLNCMLYAIEDPNLTPRVMMDRNI